MGNVAESCKFSTYDRKYGSVILTNSQALARALLVKCFGGFSGVYDREPQTVG